MLSRQWGPAAAGELSLATRIVLVMIVAGLAVAGFAAAAPSGPPKGAHVMTPFGEIDLCLTEATDDPERSPTSVARTEAPAPVAPALAHAVGVAQRPPVVSKIDASTMRAGPLTISYQPLLDAVPEADDVAATTAGATTPARNDAGVEDALPFEAAAARGLSDETPRSETRRDGPVEELSSPPQTLRVAQIPGRASPIAPVSVALAGGALALVGALALYHRLRSRGVLEHATRDELFRLITASPGITLQELSARTGVGYETTVYHVDRLRKEGLALRTGEKPMRLFAVDVAPLDRIAIVALRTEGAARVLAAIEAAPGTSKSAISRAVGIAPPSVTWHVERLRNAGLIEVVPAGLGFSIMPNVERVERLRARIAEPAAAEPASA